LHVHDGIFIVHLRIWNLNIDLEHWFEFKTKQKNGEGLTRGWAESLLGPAQIARCPAQLPRIAALTETLGPPVSDQNTCAPLPSLACETGCQDVLPTIFANGNWIPAPVARTPRLSRQSTMVLGTGSAFLVLIYIINLLSVSGCNKRRVLHMPFASIRARWSRWVLFIACWPLRSIRPSCARALPSTLQCPELPPQ
jgi:hypothetical protein